MSIRWILGGLGAVALASVTAEAQLRHSGVFKDTVSPYGPYALAWAEEGRPIDWDSSEQDHVDIRKEFVNFIVDVQSRTLASS